MSSATQWTNEEVGGEWNKLPAISSMKPLDSPGKYNTKQKLQPRIYFSPLCSKHLIFLCFLKQKI
jgi:hypothetical protein